jgi:hypothetical protein
MALSDTLRLVLPLGMMLAIFTVREQTWPPVRRT